LIASSVTFLTPEWALLALSGLLPLAALALAARRERRARAALALRPPRGDGRWGRAAAIVAIAALLGLAASQPVIRSTAVVKVRTDAAAIYVIDNSRSMLASRKPGATTRIARARAAAIRLRASLPQVPSGVATMTDRVLPDLMPISDDKAFDRTVQEAVQVNEPPPGTNSVTATNLASLGALGTQNFFAPNAKHRVAIVLTDGESQPFDVRQTARELGHLPGVTPIFVQFWSPHDQVFDPDGQPESAYHPDASSKEDLQSLAAAAHGTAFGEDDLDAVTHAVRSALGSGPVRPMTTTTSTRPLAPYFALTALLPLLFVLLDGLWVAVAAAGQARRRGGPAESDTAAGLTLGEAWSTRS
jgi:von Willebrand factor type A domain